MPQRTNWLTIIVLFSAGLVGSMQFAKLSPMMMVVAEDLKISPVTAGLSVSILGLVGVLFAVTVGAVANALGLARMLRFALMGGAIVAFAGAYAPEANTFLLSRFLEGVSHLFIVVCAPALMANAAAPRDKPLALALWGCFFGAGYAITSIAMPYIAALGNWRTVLIAHAFAMAVVAAAVWAVTSADRSEAVRPSARLIARRHLDVFRSGPTLLLALTFFAYTAQFLAVLTFLALFMSEVLNWGPDRVGQALFMAPLLSLIFTLASGFLVRLGLGIATGFSIAFGVLAAATAFTFATEPVDSRLIISIAIMMACFGLLPGLTFANMPRVAKTPEQVALGFSAIALFGNLGTFVGTPLLAQAYVSGSWQAIAATLVVMCLIGGGLAIALSRKVRNDLRVGS